MVLLLLPNAPAINERLALNGKSCDQESSETDQFAPIWKLEDCCWIIIYYLQLFREGF